jgi:hypothetical protein
MAVIDSGGVQFAPMAPQINYGALAGVRPLSFGQNPLQFQPMPQFDVGQTKPYIAEGIGKAFEAIGAGITVGYKRQDALKELAIKQAQFDRQQTAKEADDKLRRESEKIRAEAEKLRATASEIKERGKAVGVTDTSLSDYGDDSGGTKSGGVLSGTTAEPSRKLAEIDFGSGADDSGEPEPRGRVEARRLGEERLRRAEASGQLPQPGLELVAEGLSAPQVSLLGDMEKPAPIQLGVDYLPAPQFGLGLASAPSRPQPALQSPAFASLKPPGAQQEPLPLPQTPSAVTVGQLVGAPEPAGGAPVDFSDPVGAAAPKTKSGALAPVALVPNQRGGAMATANEANRVINTFNASGHPTLRAVGSKYHKDGYEIIYENIEEQKRKADERASARSASENIKIQKVRNTEGKAIVDSPAVKLHESSNGAKRQMQAFAASYESARDFPKSAGAADIDMINSYIRATSGGKVTENEVKLLQHAKSWAERFGFAVDKPQSGAALTQSQRDQMMRTMAHITNMSATSANGVLSVGRDRLLKGGVQDEIYLPQPYVDNLVPKKDVPFLLNKFKDNINSLNARRVDAKKSGNKKKEDLLSNQIKELLKQQEELARRFDEEDGITSSPLLGGHDFEHKRQGHVAGSGYLTDMPSAEGGNSTSADPRDSL